MLPTGNLPVRNANMLAQVQSGVVLGVTPVPIAVEVDVASRGLPTVTIVGLPDKAIEESRERVRTALTNCGYSFPLHRVVVNLLPADIPKQGQLYDCAIALGILVASAQLPGDMFQNALILGGLSLDGSSVPTPGSLPLLTLAAAKRYARVFLPLADYHLHTFVPGVELCPVEAMSDYSAYAREYEGTRTRLVAKASVDILERKEIVGGMDLSAVIGQEQAKHALLIAAAGGHNVGFVGPAGCGKTMLARSLPGILPPLSSTELLEVLTIRSVLEGYQRGDFPERPFRAPHHTISRVGLIGGGNPPLPGELSMAHRGVLFLDELPEFPRAVLESLRQPLEDGSVLVSRARMSLTFPTKFQLITAQNPCPCGNYGHPSRPCTCSTYQRLTYGTRISGPLRDRIDMWLTLTIPRLDAPHTSHRTSAEYRDLVEEARERQQARFQSLPYECNAEVTALHLREVCTLSPSAEQLLTQAQDRFALSLRSVHKVIKVARTLADLSCQDVVEREQIAQALHFRTGEGGRNGTALQEGVKVSVPLS